MTAIATLAAPLVLLLSAPDDGTVRPPSSPTDCRPPNCPVAAPPAPPSQISVAIRNGAQGPRLPSPVVGGFLLGFGGAAGAVGLGYPSLKAPLFGIGAVFALAGVARIFADPPR